MQSKCRLSRRCPTVTLAGDSFIETHPDGARVADLKFDDVGRGHEPKRMDGGLVRKLNHSVSGFIGRRRALHYDPGGGGVRLRL